MGTCKHIEALKFWIVEKGKRVCRRLPANTSMYLSYIGERKVCLRIGTDHAEEFEHLAKDYLAEDSLNYLLHVSLYPYQKQGIRFAFRAGKSIIADEIGLGKTSI